MQPPSSRRGSQPPPQPAGRNSGAPRRQTSQQQNAACTSCCSKGGPAAAAAHGAGRGPLKGMPRRCMQREEGAPQLLPAEPPRACMRPRGHLLTAGGPQGPSSQPNSPAAPPPGAPREMPPLREKTRGRGPHGRRVEDEDSASPAWPTVCHSKQAALPVARGTPWEAASGGRRPRAPLPNRLQRRETEDAGESKLRSQQMHAGDEERTATLEGELGGPACCRSEAESLRSVCSCTLCGWESSSHLWHGDPSPAGVLELIKGTKGTLILFPEIEGERAAVRVSSRRQATVLTGLPAAACNALRGAPQAAEGGSLFRGLGLAFLGFDVDSLLKAAAAAGGSPPAAAAAAAAHADAEAARALLALMEKKAAAVSIRQLAAVFFCCPRSFLPLCCVLLLLAAACGSSPSRASKASSTRSEPISASGCMHAFLFSLWLPQEGARVVDVEVEGCGAASFLVCNFAAAFARLSRLFTSKQQQQQQQQEEGAFPPPTLPAAACAERQQQLAALWGLEPLRLVTPFWLFACLRDRRVYAPDVHPLFLLSAAFTPYRPPLSLQQQQEQQQQQQQGVLLLGFTRRQRRVRQPSGFAYGLSASDSDEAEEGGVPLLPPRGPPSPGGGLAVALNDLELAAACVEALGGRRLLPAEVEEAAPLDLVAVVGRLPRRRRTDQWSPVSSARATPHASSPAAAEGKKKKTAADAAAAELSLLQRLQQQGVPCVRLEWLLDAYRLGRRPPLAAYAVPPHQLQQQQQQQLAAPSAAAARRAALQGVQILLSDAAVSGDPGLLRRAAELGCTDSLAAPALLLLCPWLFSSSATRPLAAVLCGSRERMLSVEAALERAACAWQQAQQQQQTQQQTPVLFVLQREGLAGLLDLAAAAAEALEAPEGAPRQQQPAARRAPAQGGRSAGSRSHAARERAAASQQQQQQQQETKIGKLLVAAQQHILQGLSPAAAEAAQQQWAAAAAAAGSSSSAGALPCSHKGGGPPNHKGGGPAEHLLQGSQGPLFGSAAADARPPVVSVEWLVGCWEEARRLPLDATHGLLDLDFSVFFLFLPSPSSLLLPALRGEGGGASQEVADSREEAALQRALAACGGAVFYGELPEETDAGERR
ncbi:hypothetical protein Efla_006216 [Eimeria flavescens]